MKRVQLTVAVLAVLACAGVAQAASPGKAEAAEQRRGVGTGDAGPGVREQGRTEADAWATARVPGPWSPVPTKPILFQSHE